VNIQDKVAIVTGASSGIGLATAKLLSSKAAKLALVSRSKAKLEQLSKKLLDAVAIPAELKGDNIVVSVVYPYITLTNFEDNTIKDASLQGLEESPDAQEAFK
jgi:short-subunit dehydrogenase